MANEEHLKILIQGTSAWNEWRKTHAGEFPGLSNTDFSDASFGYVDCVDTMCGLDVPKQGIYLRFADLGGANLRNVRLVLADLAYTKLDGADLTTAELHESDLTGADLRHANLHGAFLIGTDLSRADLSHADLSFAKLDRAHFDGTNLMGTTFDKAGFNGTILVDLDLSKARDLDSCRHLAPSPIDHRTLENAGQLPLSFLRGVGLSDELIEHLPSLYGRAIEYYSCFISYSSANQELANRAHADLQDNGVRCWFAPEDMKIGEKILDTVDSAIRLRDKILLILSESSITSEWVEDEVTAGFEEERKRGETVLFPIRIDDAVMDSKEAWAAKLRHRHIGDFREWKDHDDYQKAFERLLRDLKKRPKARPSP